MSEESPATKGEVRALLAKVVDLHRITAIVSIDDVHATQEPDIESVIGAARSGRLLSTDGDPKAVRELFVDDRGSVREDDELAEQIRARWDDLEPPERQLLSKRAADLDQVDPPPLPAEKLDEWFAPLPVHKYSGLQWRDAAPVDVGGGKALFLIDRDFSNESLGQNFGTEVVRGIAEQGLPVAGYALFTHTIGPEGEEALLDAVLEDLGNPQLPLVVISKRANPARLPERVLLAGLGAELRTLASDTSKALSTATSDACAAIGQLGLDVLLRLLQAAEKEGAWAPEHFLRYANSFVLRGVEMALRSPDVAQTLERIAAARKFGLEHGVTAQPAVWKFNHRERYRAADDINSLLLPIACGDVFSLGDGETYALVSQPCELMVRRKGCRDREKKDRFKQLSFVRVRPAGKSDTTASDALMRLPHFDSSDGSAWEAVLGDRLELPGLVVDLCAFNSSGLSRLCVADDKPATLPPPWSVRFDHARAQVATILQNYRDRSAEGVMAAPNSLLQRYDCGLDKLSPVHAEIGTADQTVTYGLRRVARILDPLATDLLIRATQQRGRLALLSDLVADTAPSGSQDRDARSDAAGGE